MPANGAGFTVQALYQGYSERQNEDLSIETRA